MITGITVAAACVWIHRKCIKWYDWAELRHEKMKQEVAEIERINRYLKP